MKKHEYHHKWCAKCGGMTVHDAGICTRCTEKEDGKKHERILPTMEKEPKNSRSL